MTRHFLLICLTIVTVAVYAGCGDDGEPQDSGWLWGDLFPPQGDGGSGSCSSANCAGCCMGTQCMGGTMQQACGYGGVPCQTCQSTETCQMGFCTPTSTCDASSCPNGCCDSSNQCQSGDTDSACGTGGASCQSCSSSEVCSAAGSCIVKGSGSYQVVLVSAKITDKWTVCGWSGLYPEAKCDPYVEITVGSSTKTSSTQADTHSPTWNEPLLVASETDLTGQVKVRVMDEDTGPDETIGECYPKITSADLAAGQKVDNCGANVSDLTFDFKPQ